MHIKPIRHCAAAMALCAATGMGIAQAAAPVRIVVAFPPGGPADTLARVVAKEAAPILDATVVVENKPGANGALAANEAKRAKPDGTTVFLSSTGAIAINPGLYKKLTYNPAKDFVPVTMLVSTPEVLALSSTKEMKTFDAFSEQSKKQGTTLSSSGIGSMPHMAISLLKRATGLNILHVPYSGAAPAIKDSIGGQVDGFFGDVSGLLKYLEDGRLIAVGTASKQRLKALPDVPTFAELGYPDVVAINWYGVFAPAGTPPDVVKRLNDAFNKAMQTPAAQDFVKTTGVETYSTTPEEFATMVKEDAEKWARLIAEENITVNE